MDSSDTEPYVGLRHYDIGDAHRFFGRSRESWELTSLLLSSRLVVVYGPSGVGKTSLLLAGVLAGLSDDVAHVLPVARPPKAATPTTSPGHNPLTYELLSTWAPDVAPDALQGLTLSRFLRQVPVGRDRYDEATLPLIVVIDQFEEVFSDGRYWAHDRERFLSQLAWAVEDVEHLHLVLSMRQDAVGELLSHESRLSAGNRRRYRVDPLERDMAIEAVTGPLQTTRRRFAPAAAGELVDHLMTTTLTNEVGEQRTVVADTVEPMNLQVACSALWRGLPEDLTIVTSAQLHEDGYVEAALTTYCASAVIDIAVDEELPEPALWQWLAETFITDLGTRGTAYEGIASTGGMPNAVARAFEAHRILRSEKRSGSVWFELLHDVLIEPLRRGSYLSERFTEAAGPARPRNVHLRKAEYALHSGMPLLAEEYARDAVKASDSDLKALAEANSLLGKLLFERGRAQTAAQAEESYENAAEHYRRAAELFDAEENARAVGQALASLGRLSMERGRFTDAVGALQAAVNRLRNDVDVRLDLARALQHSGQPGAALGEYVTILAIAPDGARHERAEALVGRGALAAEHGDPSSALRDLDHAIRLEPELAGRVDVVLARGRAFADLERRPNVSGEASTSQATS